MKNLKIYSVFFFLLLGGGCSSRVSETNSANSVAAANSSATTSTNNLQSNPSSSQTAQGPARVVPEVDPNAFNANPLANARVVPVDPKQDKNKSAVYGRTAPDDSTFFSTMDAKGMMMEVRKFNNSPYLIKVERVFTTPNKTMKIYLKNGKIVEVGEDKLPNFAATAPGNILEAAGVDLTKLAPQNEGKKENQDKKQ